MIKHFIITSSSYTEGTRIAIDYPFAEEIDVEFIRDQIIKVRERCGDDVSIATNSIYSKDLFWESVCESDPLFVGIKLIDSIDEFIKLIKQDRTLRGIDVARYILSIVPCSHLKLQKLLYLCYADYLCECGGQLFTDDIYAFKLGPVVQSVYHTFKGSTDDIQTIYDLDQFQMLPNKSRILFAEDGLKKVFTINKVRS